MKKVFSIITLLTVLALLLAGCGNKEPSEIPDGYQIASSQDCDYIFYVPETWKIDSSTLYTSAYFSSGDSSSISVTAYGMNFEDKTVDDWWEGYTKQFEEAFSEYELVTTADKTMGGIDGKQYTYTAKLADKQYNFICTAVVRGEYVYYMLYTSTPDYYEKHLDTLEEVIGYFEFK